MTKKEYEDFALRYKGCGACFPMYHLLSRFEKMWFTAIQKDIAELENKIADIKANCDLAIEGRDVKIMELEEKQRKNNGLEEQLTKAKELIELFVQWNYGCCKEPDYKNLVKQAEQFLKESE